MMMDIQPIKNEKDYDQALADIEVLWGAEEGTEKGDKLDVLLVLAENYEGKHHQISPPDPIEAIKFRMEQQGLTRKDLEPFIGGRGRVSEVMNYRRGLSISMIRSLHANLSIPLESLVNEVKLSA
ncbi:MAG TPA: transcriptional regulator [Leucothrix sp.]|nr:transcriptional regulator [Leucothrix sp.]